MLNRLYIELPSIIHTLNYAVNLFGAIGVSLNKMYNILAPSIRAIYKFLCTYGGSVHIYIYVNGAQRDN